MRSNWLDLYRRFLNGHNFLSWFRRKRAVSEQEQLRLWRQVRMKTDIKHFISKLSEVEIVESFNAIERHLGELQTGSANLDYEAASQKLKGDLLAVFNMLPKDVQQLLRMNPHREALLQEPPECEDLPKESLVQSAVQFFNSPR